MTVMTDAGGAAEPRGVGRTAIGVAYVRAGESRRADALFHDPYAQWFVDATAWTPPESREVVNERYGEFWQRVIEGAVVRTRFLDDYVLAAARAGCAQVVIPGAGLDSRAYRLAWPAGVRLFEVDTADVLGFKNDVLDGRGARPACARVPVPCDLRDDWPAALADAGLRPGEPVAWIIEGLLIYLTEEENDQMMRRVAALSAPGSRLGLTLSGFRDGLPEGGGPRTGDDPLAHGRGAMALWRSEGPEDPVAWLDAYGWDATVHATAERAAAYGRPLTATSVRPRHLVEAVRR